jgi:hypothetical protein
MAASKQEGVVGGPWPLYGPPGREARGGVRAAREAGEPRCEMCGSPVVAAHCKRICLKCGFMTGCSEGI